MDGMSLLDVLRGVMLDPAEQASYNADPHAYLEQYGYDDVDPADLSEAFGLVADTLPPDQAQAAWSAAPEPDDSTFGTVTHDFDGDAAIDGPEAEAPGSAGADEVEVEVPDVEVPDIDVPDVDGAEDAGPALSFGEGDDVDDIDDPTFGDNAGTDAVAGGPDDSGADDDIAGLTDGGDDADSAFDEGFGQSGYDTGFDDDLSDGLDDGAELGHDSADDGMDDGIDDGMGDLDDTDPDDLDIGSF